MKTARGLGRALAVAALSTAIIGLGAGTALADVHETSCDDLITDYYSTWAAGDQAFRAGDYRLAWFSYKQAGAALNDYNTKC